MPQSREAWSRQKDPFRLTALPVVHRMGEQLIFRAAPTARPDPAERAAQHLRELVPVWRRPTSTETASGLARWRVPGSWRTAPRSLLSPAPEANRACSLTRTVRPLITREMSGMAPKVETNCRSGDREGEVGRNEEEIEERDALPAPRRSAGPLSPDRLDTSTVPRR